MQGQGYKLRLGDGTTFSVDEKGLMTWLNGGLVDNKARIQPDGSKKWYSVQQVLAANAKTEHKGLDRESADKQAAAEASAIEKKIGRERAAEERKAGESAATAERKAVEQARVADRQARDAAEAADRQAAEERAAAEAAAAVEQEAARARAAEQERAEAERRAAEQREAEERRAAEARAEEERREAAAREAARVAEAERLAAQELADRKRLAEEQKAAARRAAEVKAAEAKAAEDLRQAEAREAARVAEAQRQAAEAARAAAEAERKAAEEQAARRRVADEQAARKRQADEQKAAEERRAAEQIAQAQAAAAERRAAEDRRQAEQKRAAEEKRAADAQRAAEEAAALDALAPFEPPATQVPVESLAMPAARSFEGDVAAFHKELDLGPVADPVAASAEIGFAAYAPPPPEARPAVPIPPPGPSGADMLKTTVTELGSAVSRLGAWWKRTTASKAKPAPVPPPAPPAEWSPGFLSAPPASIPSTPPPPPAPAPVPAFVSSPPPTASPSPAPPRVPAPAPRAATAALQPPKAVPPPTFKDLPVIPFAGAPAGKRPAEEPAEDVWEGDDYGEGASGSALSTAWLWVKRGTIAAALIVGAFVLATNRDAWLPRARSAALVMGGEVDRYASRAMPRSIPPQAIEAASRDIPHVRPDTLGLVMARNGKGPLQPVDVFRRAHDVAEQGRPSLPPAASAELDALLGLLADELPEGERERLKGYLARVRAHGVTANYEDQEAMWLIARAARRFPADRMGRIQELMGQAVVARLPPEP